MNGSCTCTTSNFSRAHNCLTRGPRSYARQMFATDPVAGSPKALSPRTSRYSGSCRFGCDDGATMRTSCPAPISRSASGAICSINAPRRRPVIRRYKSDLHPAILSRVKDAIHKAPRRRPPPHDSRRGCYPPPRLLNDMAVTDFLQRPAESVAARVVRLMIPFLKSSPVRPANSVIRPAYRLQMMRVASATSASPSLRFSAPPVLRPVARNGEQRATSIASK